jgi:four helix bundle protein
MATASGVKSFREIIAWQKAMSFAEIVYQITNHFPDTEKFGLVSQLRRAVVSVPSNIAEGHALRGQGNFARCLRISLGSLNEVFTQLELSVRLGFITTNTFEKLEPQAREIERILAALIRSVEHSGNKSLSP